MSTHKHCLIIDDDRAFSTLLQKGLERQGFLTTIANSIEKAENQIQKHNWTHLTLDLNLNGESGLQLIPTFKNHHPELKIVVLTGYASLQTAIDAIKLGAHHYLAKPIIAQDVIKAFDTTPHETPITDHNPNPATDLTHHEMEHIHEVLASTNYNISETARQLGIHRRTLQRKLQKKHLF